MLMTRAGPTDIYPVKASHRARAYVRRGPHITVTKHAPNEHGHSYSATFEYETVRPADGGVKHVEVSGRNAKEVLRIALRQRDRINKERSP